ncbi:MAG: hypothetical protein GX589_00580 [Deltaproteobacteria bacterium]|nr:hypothetical protein [Deltaproteobacteria bacterium]
MSSIFGIWGECPQETPQLMGSCLAHRGGAQQIECPAQNLTFGAGTSDTESYFYSDGEFSIVCDGAIYNRHELLQAGSAEDNALCGAESSAELLLNLFRTGGLEVLEAVDGDFAFAVWDKQKKALTLGRDACGTRPLYYAILKDGRGLAFASEYKALLGLEGVNVDPDLDMLQCLQYCKKLPLGRTLIKGIQAVLPGSIATFTDMGAKVSCVEMAALGVDERLSDEAQAISEIRRTLSGAIERRVSNPSRIGIALSGGIDSIGIAFICRSLFPQAEIHTFTAGFGDQKLEIETAADVARAIGAHHHAVQTPPGLMKDHLEKLVWHLEDPIARSESLQLLKIGQVASSCVDSLLCGMESDALFAGMSRHKVLRMMSRWGRCPFARKALGDIYNLGQNGLPPRSVVGMLLARLCFRNMSAPVPKVEGSCYVPARTEFPKERSQLVNRFLAASFRKGACQDGQKLERTFAAWGVQYRSPFLDRELVKTAFSIPDDLKFKNGQNKYILRKALEAWVPKEFSHTPKKPQRMNYDLEFAAALDEAVERCFYEDLADSNRIFSPGCVEALKLRKRNGVYRDEEGMRIWTAVLTKIWHKQFVLRSPLYC